MKNKVLILLVIFFSELANCQQKMADLAKIENDDFKRYVSYFPQEELPFSTLKEIEITYHNLDKNTVKRFICNNASCLKDWSGYDIEFSPYVYLPSNGDYIILIHDESTEGGTTRKLLTYDYQGKKIAELEVFAEKPFHGSRPANEITYYEIESTITKDLIIEKKYFASEQEWTEGKEFFYYGTHIAYKYKIENSGKIILLEENNFGRKKYKGARLKTNEFPPYAPAD